MPSVLRHILLLVILVLPLSCDRPKMIPRRDFVKIYTEMFLADQWVEQEPSRRREADTSAVYAPILEKYGYTVEDYDYSVGKLMEDPDRMVTIYTRVKGKLSRRSARLERICRAHREKKDFWERARRIDVDWFLNRLDSLDRLPGNFRFRADSLGRIRAEKVIHDTLFRGPELLVDTTLRHRADSLAALADSLVLVAADSLAGVKESASHGASARPSENVPAPAQADALRDEVPQIKSHRPETESVVTGTPGKRPFLRHDGQQVQHPNQRNGGSQK